MMLMHSSPEAAYYCFVMRANDVFRSYLSLNPEEQVHNSIVSASSHLLLLLAHAHVLNLQIAGLLMIFSSMTSICHNVVPPT